MLVMVNYAYNFKLKIMQQIQSTFSKQAIGNRVPYRTTEHHIVSIIP